MGFAELKVFLPELEHVLNMLSWKCSWAFSVQVISREALTLSSEQSILSGLQAGKKKKKK